MGKKLLVVASTLLLLFALCSSSHAWPIPDTGQTKCYNNTGEIPCPQPGEPFYGQDGNYTINPPSYTKLDANGNDLTDSATEWVMVRDNVTGLVWEMKNNMDGVQDYSNAHDADNTYTWYDSNPLTNGGSAGSPGDGTDTEDFINALNSASFGVFSGWRLPTIKELRSFVDYSENNPAINWTYFASTSTYRYWSSSYGVSGRWSMNFYDGDDFMLTEWNLFYARAVRGNKSEDRVSAQTWVGGDFAIASLYPEIVGQSPNLFISPNSPQAFFADISDLEGIEAVWAVVVPPNYVPPPPSQDLEAPEVVLPAFNLTDQEKDGRYEGGYSDFAYNGEYRITFYARNAKGNVSVSPATIVTVSG